MNPTIIDIPSLRDDRLAETIPVKTWGGGPVDDPTKTFVTFRTRALDSNFKGATLGFFTEDWRFAAVWREPSRYARYFLECGLAAVCEIDCSVWRDASREEQKAAIFRTRMVSRVFQGHGLKVTPNLSWADEESFHFCFKGIPRGCPVAALECVTPGGNPEDRQRFIAGLTEAVNQVNPRTILIYGGSSHQRWLTPALPEGPRYVLLDSFSRARAQFLKREAQKNQLSLFVKEAA